MDFVALGRDVEDANARAAFGRRQCQAALGGLARAPVDACGRLTRVPHLEERRAGLTAHLLNALGRCVRDDDGFAGIVVAGYDSAEVCWHGSTLPSRCGPTHR